MREEEGTASGATREEQQVGGRRRRSRRSKSGEGEKGEQWWTEPVRGDTMPKDRLGALRAVSLVSIKHNVIQ